VWALPLLWLMAFLAFTAAGLLIVNIGRPGRYSIFDQFWAGIAVAIAALQVVHFIFPIRPGVALPIAAACAAIGAWDGLARLRHVSRGVLVTVAAFTAWAAVASLNAPPQFDFGLYHLQSVRWNQSLPIVPGLANLYWPLGQNSGAFLLAAALDPGSFTRVQAYHVTGGLFVVVLAAEACVALGNVWSSDRLQPSDVFRAMGLPLAGSLVGNWLPTLSPDVAVIVLGYAAAARLAEALLDDERSSEAANGALLIAAAGVAMKLTNAPYFAVMILVSAWAAMRGHARKLRVTNVGIACVLVAAWIAGATVVSGYPLYPWPGWQTNVPWLMPRARLESHVLETFWHVRASGTGTPLDDWLTGAWPHLIWMTGKFQVLLPSGLGVLAGLVMVLFRLRPAWRAYGVLAVPAVCGAVAWFAGAPEPRLAGAIFWHAGITVVTAAATAALPLRRSDLVRPAIAATAVCLLLVYIATGSRARAARPPWEGAVSVGSPPLTSFVTRSGLRLHVPTQNNLCLDAPLPCTPEPLPELALRRAPDLAAGFVLSESR
jgi:hypothetical protein